MAPIKSRVSDDDLTIHTVEGNVHLEDIFAHIREYNRSGPTRNTLWDFRGGKVPSLPTDAMQQRAKQTAVDLPPHRVGKVAMLVAESLDFGALSIWSEYSESLVDSLELKVFYDYDRALTWLRGEPG